MFNRVGICWIYRIVESLAESYAFLMKMRGSERIMTTDHNQLWTRADGYVITTDKAHLDIETIYQFLHHDSYWVKGISRLLVEKSVENSSLCYGIYQGNPTENGEYKQVGFARIVTDFVRYAWLGDVFVLPEHRGKGLSKWMMGIIVEHPYLKGVSFHLGTQDAHTLYQQFGFRPLANPENRLARPLDMAVVSQAYEHKT